MNAFSNLPVLDVKIGLNQKEIYKFTLDIALVQKIFG